MALENFIVSIVEVFTSYASEGGEEKSLNKAELKKILEHEITSPQLLGKINGDDIDDAMAVLDKDDDGEITFGEFYKCLGKMARKYYQSKTGKGGRKGKGRRKKSGGDEDDA